MEKTTVVVNIVEFFKISKRNDFVCSNKNGDKLESCININIFKVMPEQTATTKGPANPKRTIDSKIGINSKTDTMFKPLDKSHINNEIKTISKTISKKLRSDT